MRPGGYEEMVYWDNHRRPLGQASRLVVTGTLRLPASCAMPWSLLKSLHR